MTRKDRKRKRAASERAKRRLSDDTAAAVEVSGDLQEDAEVLGAAEKAVLEVVREIPDGLMSGFAVAAARRAGAKNPDAIVRGLADRRFLAYQRTRFGILYHPGSRAREYFRLNPESRVRKALLAGARSGKTASGFEEFTGVPLHPAEDGEMT